jgi:hypothetical protein
MHITEAMALELSSRIPGMMPEADLRFLFQYAQKMLTNSTWIEVGTWKGRSLAAVVLGLPARTTVLAVDTWLGTEDEIEGTPFAEAVGSDKPFEAFQKVARGLHFLRPEIRIGSLRSYSGTVARVLGRDEPHTADVIFLDGDHSYEAVIEDIRLWTPVLKLGGTLMGHDRQLPGVARALKDLEFSFHEGGECIWYVEDYNP